MKSTTISLGFVRGQRLRSDRPTACARKLATAWPGRLRRGQDGYGVPRTSSRVRSLARYGASIVQLYNSARTACSPARGKVLPMEAFDVDDAAGLKDYLAAHWQFSWPLMDVLIAGKSAIDLSAISVASFSEATKFMQNYGYNPEEPKDKKKIHASMVEALRFIAEHLMPKEWEQGLRPPAEVFLCRDARDLLLWASLPLSASAREQRQQAWACAILKIMHTISHLDDLQRLQTIPKAREQILGRFQRALFRDQQGRLWLGSAQDCIQLEKFEWKLAKTRESMLLKLLHKPANVAETIFDLLGVRIVTKHFSDALIAVKYLEKFYLVDFAHTHPARVRNNLVDVEAFQQLIEGLRQQLLAGTLSPEAFVAQVQSLHTPVKARAVSNPHSSQQFQAIQLTCRQRVRYPHPHLAWQEKIQTFLQTQTQKPSLAPHDQQLLQGLVKLAQAGCEAEKQQEIAVFFPFEVQIMDAQAALNSENGEASHDRYKKAQVRTARRRILARILNI